MVDLAIDPLVTACKTSVPPWATDLAPIPADARTHSPHGLAGSLELARGEDAVLVTAVVNGVTHLAAEELRAVVSETFTAVLGRVRETGFATPVRMWNFVPGIHQRMGEGLDRYRVFNLGRYDSFSRWFAPVARNGSTQPSGVHCNGHSKAAEFVRELPAASAVGHNGDHLHVSALALRNPGRPVENPRQVPAFAYSCAHGPRPPCFARATVAAMPGGSRLLVSGTASIRGEDSVHPGSLEGQLAETFENIDQLARGVKGEHRFDLSGVESARVYFPRPADRAFLAAGVCERLPATAAVEFSPAWICRSELLVEIEAIIAPSSLLSPPC